MVGENKEEQSFWEKLQHTYRLVIMNNETFEEVGSYRLTLLNVYIILSTLLVLLTALIVLLIVFTPIKSYIPGYGNIENHRQMIDLRNEVDDMEAKLAAITEYNEAKRKVLIGNLEELSYDESTEVVIEDTAITVDRVKEDELLRQEMEMSKRLQQQELLSKAANYIPEQVSLEQLYFTPPVSGIVSAGYMPEKKHYGVDVLAPKNTPIKAIMDGFIIASDWTLETGNTIGIQHSNNLISFYKHNSALLKEIGSYVKAGEAVAIIGNTGTLSDGPHLHFELWHKGKTVDPAEYVKFD